MNVEEMITDLDAVISQHCIGLGYDQMVSDMSGFHKLVEEEIRRRSSSQGK